MHTAFPAASLSTHTPVHMYANRWRHIHVSRNYAASVSFYHHRLSLGFLLCPFSCCILFSLLHFLSHRGSGGPPPQSIMAKSQSTAAQSGHSDKLVKKEEAKERRRKERREGLHWESGGWACWVHCTVKVWARSSPGRVRNGWVSQCHW